MEDACEASRSSLRGDGEAAAQARKHNGAYLSVSTSPRVSASVMDCPDSAHTYSSDGAGSTSVFSDNVPILRAPPSHEGGVPVHFTLLHDPTSAPPRSMPRMLATDTIRSLIIFAVLLVTSLLVLLLVFSLMPDPKEVAREAGQDPSTVMLKIPTSFEELRVVKATLELYRGRRFLNLVALYTTLYVFLQTFMVPGCFFLNLLVGALFPFFPALLYITAITTLGCTLNFLISKHLFAGLIKTVLVARVAAFRAAVTRHQAHLFYFLMLLRVVPALPSWAINITCPIVGISLRDFALSTAIGFQPQFWVFINAGRTMGNLHSWRDLYSWQAVGTLLLCACLTLVPVIGKKLFPSAFKDAPVIEREASRSGSLPGGAAVAPRTGSSLSIV